MRNMWNIDCSFIHNVSLQVFEVERDTKELPTGYLSLHDGYCITRALLPERKRHLVLLPGHIMVNSVLEVQHATGTHSLLKLVCSSYLIIIYPLWLSLIVLNCFDTCAHYLAN